MGILRSLLASFVLVFLPPFMADGQYLPAMFFFGDSVFDIGNNNELFTLIKANFPPYGRDFTSQQPTGRFCNGKLACDFAGLSFSNSLVQFFFFFLNLYTEYPGLCLDQFLGKPGQRAPS
jgi:hypothetical protein